MTNFLESFKKTNMRFHTFYCNLIIVSFAIKKKCVFKLKKSTKQILHFIRMFNDLKVCKKEYKTTTLYFGLFRVFEIMQ